MRIQEFVSFGDLDFQTGNVGKLRMYNSPQGVFGLGQEGVIQSQIEKLKALAREHIVSLIVVGTLVGFTGAILLKDTPFGPIVSTVGAFVMAGGLVPLVLGAV